MTRMKEFSYIASVGQVAPCPPWLSASEMTMRTEWCALFVKASSALSAKSVVNILN